MLTKVHIVKAMVFPVVMYRCESLQTIKKAEHQNWCLWTLVLKKTLENPLDSKEIKQVNPKGNQPWIFSGRTDAEAETPILWPLDAKSQLIGKVPDAGKDWRQGKKGMTEDEMVGWHHWLNRHEFEQTPTRWWRTGSLACGSPWGHKESDTTEWLNWAMLDNLSNGHDLNYSVQFSCSVMSDSIINEFQNFIYFLYF